MYYRAPRFHLLVLISYFFSLLYRLVPLSMDDRPPSMELGPQSRISAMRRVTGFTSACGYPWINLASMDPILHPRFSCNRSMFRISSQIFRCFSFDPRGESSRFKYPPPIRGYSNSSMEPGCFVATSKGWEREVGPSI